jgi:CDP-diacylglycerol--glycerol-3-phosphate 3-phosphatidyltransferase
MSVFIAFLAAGLIPWWMVLIFVYRDSLISTMRTVCAYRGEVVAARTSGKLKAIIQATVIIAILTGRIASALFPALLPTALLNEVAWWLVLVAALYTLYSLYEYVAANWAIVSSAGRAQPGARSA